MIGIVELATLRTRNYGPSYITIGSDFSIISQPVPREDY